MILIGRNFSPFVRRTAASLALLDQAFEQRVWSTTEYREQILAYNPLGRVPALVLDDGEVLLDSGAILDALDDMAGPERALVPAGGAARRAVLRAVALGVGSIEKTVAAYSESRRPAGLVSEAQVERLSAQAAGGFAALDALAAGGGWLAEGRLTQADVTATVALDFAELVLPAMVGGRFPALAALRDRANAVPAIGGTR